MGCLPSRRRTNSLGSCSRNNPRQKTHRCFGQFGRAWSLFWGKKHQCVADGRRICRPSPKRPSPCAPRIQLLVSKKAPCKKPVQQWQDDPVKAALLFKPTQWVRLGAFSGPRRDVRAYCRTLHFQEWPAIGQRLQRERSNTLW
jgi:hypothetical protein